MTFAQGTLMPFLYPCLSRVPTHASRPSFKGLVRSQCRRGQTTSSTSSRNVARLPDLQVVHDRSTRLDPIPSDYSRSIFVDKCTVQVHAGPGGNGCVSFLREKYTDDGPPNGGDGGSGGNVWIQAVAGHTSLHKIARRGIIKADRGIGGQGKSQGGSRGEDVVIQVPVGTVVREIWRSDPVAEEEERLRLLGSVEDHQSEDGSRRAFTRDRWVLYPGATSAEASTLELPRPLRPRKSNLAMMQPPAPITLDLSENMEKPTLLIAGGMGGLGNPHFMSSSIPKPKYASKGELGARIKLEMELKLLADVGLVGLPNAGKSTLLRSISRSRTRVGDWAFTTLSPNIGTVVLDNNEGRPIIDSRTSDDSRRTNFTVADIPGLIEGAHEDKGLGLGFLRHIERAGILAFVVDLSAGDAVLALQNLWKEVGEYEKLRDRELNEDTENRMVDWSGFDKSRATSKSISGDAHEDDIMLSPEPSRVLEPLKLPPISSKPWFVVGTKADKDETQHTFANLQAYMQGVQDCTVPHPSGAKNAWRSKLAALPVSAIRGEGVKRIPEWTAALLDSQQP